MLRVGALPAEALAAAAKFHAQVMPRVFDAVVEGDHLVLVFGAADHTHRDWRNGVVRGLARQFAPIRVNAIAGGDEQAIAATAQYLARSPGVTGQVLPIDGTGAGPMLYHPG
jgi:hypothetical protein